MVKIINMDIVEFFLVTIGVLCLINIIYRVVSEWIRNEKKDPWLNRLDKDTLDRIKLESEDGGQSD